MSVVNNIKITSWKSITIGQNLKLKKASRCDVISDEIDLNRTKSNFVLITANKEECTNYIPSLIYSSSVNNIKPSGRLILLCAVNNKSFKTEKIWSVDDMKNVMKSKPNILNANNSHHDSKGFYASFGNKGSFNKSTYSSVGQYCNKKSASKEKQLQINDIADRYEKYAADEIARSTKCLSAILPKINKIISPIVSTAFELQSLKQDINIKERYASNSGCWQSSICVDATTGIFHTEHDCTYTLITIPNQTTMTSKKTGDNYHFLFSLMDKKVLNVPLHFGISFIFSAAFLTHRQNRNEYMLSNDEVFFNMASYGNKRLYNHIKKSFNKT